MSRVAFTVRVGPGVGGGTAGLGVEGAAGQADVELADRVGGGEAEVGAGTVVGVPVPGDGRATYCGRVLFDNAIVGVTFEGDGRGPGGLGELSVGDVVGEGLPVDGGGVPVGVVADPPKATPRGEGRGEVAPDVDGEVDRPAVVVDIDGLPPVPSATVGSSEVTLPEATVRVVTRGRVAPVGWAMR
jgi:hypothetical protein